MFIGGLSWQTSPGKRDMWLSASRQFIMCVNKVISEIIFNLTRHRRDEYHVTVLSLESTSAFSSSSITTHLHLFFYALNT